MPDQMFLGFDFGFKRIGVAVGQRLTSSASPLPTLIAKQGEPDWDKLGQLINQWKPAALVVGLPTRIDESEFYTTAAARGFAKKLRKRYALPVHLEDERLTTTEARARIFEEGGFKKLKSSEVDSMAACIILEQWLLHHSD